MPTAFPVVPLLAVAALGVLGTGLAMLVQYGIVAEVGPTTGQMVTYFVPVIATAAGVTLLDEPLAWNTPVGAVIVLAGAALTRAAAPGADGPPRRRGTRHPDPGHGRTPTGFRHTRARHAGHHPRGRRHARRHTRTCHR